MKYETFEKRGFVYIRSRAIMRIGALAKFEKL